ncbi:hypothetical protein INT46_008739 [Mucor plumbeus]|uniref:CCHC-type domain-containing protein n=1 Tax=Mucor plumbeus TaxID=97098 RepID=A0A8H7QBT7_9FUNG|nr:hypothetical protein INT46_008739 [Mucor plumbeus]
MSDNNSLSWAEMASRHGEVRYFQQTKRRMTDSAVSNYPLVGSILYEDDDLKGQILASKAMAIIQQALTSGSVLFSFRKGLFGDRVDAYKVIQTQISSLVEFRPLSVYDDKNDGSLLLEAKFEQVEDANKALTDGVNIDGVVYKAVLAKETREFGELKYVQFTLMRIVREPTFLVDLMESLSYYGKVLQVKQFTRGGFFEGKFSVMLDTSVGCQVGDEWQQAKPLDRMLYLREFDCFVAAAYKGAPPVCHFCRQSGHIRAKCPELAKRRCFGCNKHGHMLKFCPEGEAKKQADYLKKQKVSKAAEQSEEVVEARDATITLLDFVDREKVGDGKKGTDMEEDVQSLGDASVVDHSEKDEFDSETSSLEEEDMEVQREDHQVNEKGDDTMEDDEVVLAGGAALMRGAAYSKYAPNSVALTMQVDKPAEMLNMTSLRAETKRKMEVFNHKLKTGGSSGAGVKRGDVAGGVTGTGVGAKSVKTGGSGDGAGVQGLKANKNDGKLPTTTKQDARRAQ